MKPAIAEAKNNFAIVQHETFAPILYLLKYSDLDEAIDMQNDVLKVSSSIMTTNLREAERFYLMLARIVVLPTILVLRVQRLAVLLAVKKKLVVDVSLARMLGKVICVAKPIL